MATAVVAAARVLGLKATAAPEARVPIAPLLEVGAEGTMDGPEDAAEGTSMV